MQPRVFLVAALLLAPATLAGQTPAPVSSVAARAPAAELPATPTRALFDQYCVSCHNDRTRQGGLSLADVGYRFYMSSEERRPGIRRLRRLLVPEP